MFLQPHYSEPHFSTLFAQCPHTCQNFNYKKTEEKNFLHFLLNCRSPNENLKLKFPSFQIFYKDQPRVLVAQNLVDLLQSHIHEHYYASLRCMASPSVYGPHPESYIQELSSNGPSIVHGSGCTTKEALGLRKKSSPGYDSVELETMGQVVLRIGLLFERRRQKLDKRLAC